jgi:hypothetical protein
LTAPNLPTIRIPLTRIIDDMVDQARQSHARAERAGVTPAEAARVLTTWRLLPVCKPYRTGKPRVDKHRQHGGASALQQATCALLTPYAPLVASYPRALSLAGALDRAPSELQRTVDYAVATSLVDFFTALNQEA